MIKILYRVIMDHIGQMGVQMPVIGLGTWQMTGRECERGVESALRKGYRHIDTAELYGNEREIGKALDKSDVRREEVFITTKVWRSNLSYERVFQAVDESLRKLGTNYVDLLLIHRPSYSVPLEDTVRAMDQLVEKGKTKNIGVSNFSADQMRKFQEISENHMFTNQVEYHLYHSRKQQEKIRYCQEEDILLTAYSPLARGRCVSDPVLEKIGEKYDKSPAQVELRWLIQQENVIAIPKASDPGHQKENLNVFDFQLKEEEIQNIFNQDKGKSFVTP